MGGLERDSELLVRVLFGAELYDALHEFHPAPAVVAARAAAYPMVQLPLKMVEEGRPGSKLAPLFKQRLLWIGFAVLFVLLSLKGLHYYFPAVPLPTQSAGQLPWIGSKLNSHWVYAWIGFFYLVNLDISFSIWFFYVFNKAQEGIFTSLGIASTETLSLYSRSQTADLTHEVMGPV